MSYIDVCDILDHYDIYYEENAYSSDLLILCPFHDDKHLGSSKMDRGSGLFNCYSCGAKGNIYQFVALLEDVSVRDAGILIDNDFELEQKYDTNLLDKKIHKIKVLDKDKEYNMLSKKLSLRILYTMANGHIRLPVDFIQRWLIINIWLLDYSYDDVDKKYKQALSLFSQFIKEKQRYD